MGGNTSIVSGLKSESVVASGRMAKGVIDLRTPSELLFKSRLLQGFPALACLIRTTWPMLWEGNEKVWTLVLLEWYEGGK